MTASPENLFIRPSFPNFKDLPWHLPLEEWHKVYPLLENLPRGISRHAVIFIEYQDSHFALKELPPNIAETEFNNLVKMEESRLQTVIPAGYAEINLPAFHSSVLITRYLERSIPYCSLFSMEHMSRYREHLMDAIVALLVQLHLAGYFWGDCSLSNTLFRRDAGQLQAYLVDAETSVAFSGKIPPIYRYDDLNILEANLESDLLDLTEESIPLQINPKDTGTYISLQYQKLWEEITKELLVKPGENYRLQEHIRALNNLGYSIGSIETIETDCGENLRLHVAVTDQNYHRDQLYQYTGLCTEEMQARQMINEIHELKASLSHRENRSVSLAQAAEFWMEHYYKPTLVKLQPFIDMRADPAELYCEVLENKWYLSEQARQDVGHAAATEDYIRNHIVNQIN